MLRSIVFSARHVGVRENSVTGPHVGAEVEVLYKEDGWCHGKIAEKGKEKDKWLVNFDAGDSETITIKWPNPKGDVRILGAKSKRAPSSSDEDEREESNTDVDKDTPARTESRTRRGKVLATAPTTNTHTSTRGGVGGSA